MKTKSHIKLYQKTLIALTLMLLLMSFSSAPSTHASPNATESDPRRKDHGINDKVTAAQG